jgi:hypothetical protein
MTHGLCWFGEVWGRVSSHERSIGRRSLDNRKFGALPEKQNTIVITTGKGMPSSERNWKPVEEEQWKGLWHDLLPE